MNMGLIVVVVVVVDVVVFVTFFIIWNIQTVTPRNCIKQLHSLSFYFYFDITQVTFYM